jgi:hypothetical protein
MTEEPLYTIEYENNKFEIFSLEIEEKTFMYFVFEGERVVFYREDTEKIESDKENLMKYMQQIPKEMSYNGRLIPRASVNSYLKKYMTQGCLNKFVELKYCNELDEKVKLYDLFKFANKKSKELTDDEKELYETKFNLYRIIELI